MLLFILADDIMDTNTFVMAMVGMIGLFLVAWLVVALFHEGGD
jgi:hypothetical protein